MKIHPSRKLRFTSLALVLLTSLYGLVSGALTGNAYFQLLLSKYGRPQTLLAGVVIIVAALLVVTYLRDKDSQAVAEQLDENIEPDFKKLFESLKEHYRNRYHSTKNALHS